MEVRAKVEAHLRRLEDDASSPAHRRIKDSPFSSDAIFKQVCSMGLEEGDSVIMGSDGLLGNVFDHKIVSTIANNSTVVMAGIS
ncbi:probable protein phosphatase 2C 1 [Daucus carota subsp. sativus]|uniref:probable protein phosphatase 2C 1 n=1 Tax=Daucus carota subsp. sativus TaxID=79200 RepID=UPI00308299D2